MPGEDSYASPAHTGNFYRCKCNRNPNAMQQCQILFSFCKEPKIDKDEFMTPEELQRRKDMEEAARAWNEAILKTDSVSTTIKIKEACMIAPDDCISI